MRLRVDRISGKHKQESYSFRMNNKQCRYYGLSTYLAGLAPVVIVWVVLVGWLASLLAERGECLATPTRRPSANGSINRVFSATPFPLWVRSTAALVERSADATTLNLKRDEIRNHIQALIEPTRAYDGELPTFPVIYSITMSFSETGVEPIVWEVAVTATFVNKGQRTSAPCVTTPRRRDNLDQ